MRLDAESMYRYLCVAIYDLRSHRSAWPRRDGHLVIPGVTTDWFSVVENRVYTHD